MVKRYKIYIAIACVLFLLALVGNLTAKVRKERRSHEQTRLELSQEKRHIKMKSHTIKTPIIMANGEIGYRTEITILTETEISKLLQIDERIKDEEEITERPALKKWKFKVAQEFSYGLTPGRQWYGAGYRQSLWVLEGSTWGMLSHNAFMLGLDADF